MTHAEVEVNPQGRVTIPAGLRRQLGLHPGSRLVIRVEEDRIVLEDPTAMLARLRARLAAAREAAGVTTLDSEELMADRRAEARQEAGE